MQLQNIVCYYFSFGISVAFLVWLGFEPKPSGLQMFGPRLKPKLIWAYYKRFGTQPT